MPINFFTGNYINLTVNQNLIFIFAKKKEKCQISSIVTTNS